MDVSIIIINYNTFELTSNCIRSIITKTKTSSFEIIVVDNASSERNATELLQLFPEIILIQNETNEGFAKGNNKGIARAKGEYILLLNSDAELENNAAGICLDFLKKNRNVAVATAALFYPDGKIQHNCQRFPSVRYRLFELLRLQKFLPERMGGKILLGSFFNHAELICPDWVWGTFFMFKKDLLNSLTNGKLAEDFFLYNEDMQWCKEFRKLGYQIAFIPEAKVIHHMGKSGGSRSQLIARNTEIFMRQYYGWADRMLIKFLDKLLA